MQAQPTIATPAPQPNGKPPDDLSLLRGISSGDPDSLQAFFLRWYNRFRSMGVGILRNYDAAEDAASEAVLRVRELASSGSFPAEPGEATRWIRRVGRDCAFRQRREPLTVGGEWVERLPDRDRDPGDDPDLEADERYTAIAKALLRLSQRTRSAVRMHYIDGLSYAEIAEHQGGTPAGAFSRVDRGLLQLVAITHSRRRGRQKAERADRLTPDERVQVLNTAATVRARTPDMGMCALAAEVCRRTHIFILPESASASLLMDLHHRRL